MMRFLPLQTFMDGQPTARTANIGYPARLRSSPVRAVSSTASHRAPRAAKLMAKTVRQPKPAVKIRPLFAAVVNLVLRMVKKVKVLRLRVRFFMRPK